MSSNMRELAQQGMQTSYNRLSTDHEISLEVARAIMQSTITMSIGKMKAESDGNEAESIHLVQSYASVWGLLAAHLNISELKMARIIEDALEYAWGCLTSVDKAYRASRPAAND